MNQQEKTYKPPIREFIALHLLDNLGAQRIRLLLQAVEHPQLIFRLERHELESIRGIGPKTAEEVLGFNEWDEVDQILEKTEHTGAQIMTYWDDDYPNLLREIYDPPLMLWIKGDRSVLDTDAISIVGTRRVGNYGKEMARKFAKELVDHDLTIVSGLAYGTDGAAHQAAVDAGGKTVAVLGSGIDWIYPSDHKGLAKEIVATGGAVISEFPLGTAPEMGNFPVRNRIVSGMSLGTLIAASGLEGGSMITAKSALDQNREVFVIPHPVGHPNAIGCNSLIKRGMGKLVQNVEDILTEIHVHIKEKKNESDSAGISKPSQNKWKSMELDNLSTSICEVLAEESLHIDQLAERLEIETHKLMPKLLELEMQDAIRQTAGKNFELL
ncbi:DNA-protecting protein DprA [Aliifodinibius salipaludis]|uniref:DNA-protecting protein DprA n=1 Tax=Fodinibius salipaludis TaxID=2032627 RepID=A0A2A2G983_9BACT|nr:DNA-processing protein DprA [Aliifodinibius salipaludis]PAU93429.1 DNA-protecting protein DprA [Aliifodinibius salipaludis]